MPCGLKSRGELVLEALGDIQLSALDLAHDLGWTLRYTTGVLRCMVATGEVIRIRSGWDQRRILYRKTPLIQSVRVAGQVTGQCVS